MLLRQTAVRAARTLGFARCAASPVVPSAATAARRALSVPSVSRPNVPAAAAAALARSRAGAPRHVAQSARRLNEQLGQQGQGQPIGQVEPKLSLTFTCTVPDCGHRSSHEFARRSYEKGIVIVQCPGCKNRHLIADHLGWFKQAAGEAKTVEDIVRENGGRVRRGVKHQGADGAGAGDEYETMEIQSDTHASDSGSDSDSDGNGVASAKPSS